METRWPDWLSAGCECSQLSNDDEMEAHADPPKRMSRADSLLPPLRLVIFISIWHPHAKILWCQNKNMGKCILLVWILIYVSSMVDRNKESSSYIDDVILSDRDLDVCPSSINISSHWHWVADGWGQWVEDVRRVWVTWVCLVLLLSKVLVK